MAKTSGARGEAATAIWAVLALVVVAAFLAWLAMTSEPSVIATPQGSEDTTAIAMPADTVTARLSPQMFAAGESGYVGQLIELNGVDVALRVGTQLVMVQLPTGPYVVKVGEMVTQPVQGSRVTIEGVVMQKTPAILDAWQESGVMTSGQRLIVEVGETYIDARAIRPAG